MSSIVIGIDTGGTYTDAVAFDVRERRVVAKGKARTTKEDLSCGIAAALDALPAELVRSARRVSLSTTLATNACVEGKGGRAKLVLVGTTRDVLKRIDAAGAYGLADETVLCLDTHGSFDGSVVDMPEWSRVIKENRAWLSDADAFGICEAGAARTGAACEKAGSDALFDALGVPVVRASDISSELNMMERGATALLDARLLPVIEGFMAAVGRALAERGITAPVFVVRSDSTLMGADAARELPVETIASGPAASVAGSRELAHSSDCLVVDMGGTTTDVSIVEGGAPAMSGRTRIGPWRTQVKGVYVETFGLGGDTRIIVRDGRLVLDERRVEPLSAACARWPKLKEDLRTVAERGGASKYQLHEALYLVREPREGASYTPRELELIDTLRKGPALIGDAGRINRYTLESERLESEGVVMRCGFTPTDAMHLAGDFGRYDVEGAQLAARCLANAAHGFSDTPEGIASLGRAVYRAVEKKLYENVVRIMLHHRYPEAFGEGSRGAARRAGSVMSASDGPLARMVSSEWERASNGEPAGLVDIAFPMKAVLVGVGAPTHLFLPAVARALGARFVIPEDAEVANAVGAAASTVGAHSSVQVAPRYDEFGVVGYTVHTVDGRGSTKTKDEALAAARAAARKQAELIARDRGAAGELSCSFSYRETTSHAADGQLIELGCEVAADVRAREDAKPAARRAIEAVLFDLDGTLIDTHDLILETMRYSVRTVLGHDVDDASLMEKVGQPLRVQMLDLADGDEAVRDELCRVYRERNRKVHDRLIKRFAGTAEALARLAGEGVPMGVVTSKLHEPAMHGLACCGIDGFFDVLIGPDDWPEHKPDPGPVRRGCEVLGVDPSLCAYVGDSPFDLAAGRGAGCFTVAATWGMFSTSELLACDPDATCASIGETVDLLLGMR